MTGNELIYMKVLPVTLTKEGIYGIEYIDKKLTLREISSGISGDSGEYEFLEEAVELSKDVPGMCLELGLRRGRGTKTIIDAVRQYCPDKTVVAVDPYGSILYTGREHVGPCRLDYTNQMKAETLSALWAYIAENPVDFHFFCMTDHDYFRLFDVWVPSYDLEEKREGWYSMVHLDAQHTLADVSRQIRWFDMRMLPGACQVLDDVTIDFIDIEPIKKLFIELGWELVKIGLKKGIWKKK